MKMHMRCFYTAFDSKIIGPFNGSITAPESTLLSLGFYTWSYNHHRQHIITHCINVLDTLDCWTVTATMLYVNREEVGCIWLWLHNEGHGNVCFLFRQRGMVWSLHTSRGRGYHGNAHWNCHCVGGCCGLIIHVSKSLKLGSVLLFFLRNCNVLYQYICQQGEWVLCNVSLLMSCNTVKY